jgi:hypothetical protein
MEFVNRVERTIKIGVCWLVFTVLYLAFNPAQLGFWQNVAAFIASGIIATCSIALMWTKVLSC